jgi:hypothetical protein
VMGEFDLDRAVVVSLVDPSPETLSISSNPSHVNPTDERLYSMSRPAWRAPKVFSPGRGR